MKLMIFLVFLLFMWVLLNFSIIHNNNVDKKNKNPLNSTLSCKIAIFLPTILPKYINKSHIKYFFFAINTYNPFKLANPKF